MSSSNDISTRSSAFSETVKWKVQDLSKGLCWCCGSSNPDVALVVAKCDRQVSLWADQGLLNFRVDSYLNGIALCAKCHDEFDHALDPGFTFIPTDLDYFINFEIEDRQRRKKAMEAGNQNVARQVPTVDDYKNHQIAQGKIAPDALGGLYRPILLKPYLGSTLETLFEINVQQVLSENIHSWHGAPMASLRRAFPVLGTGRSYNLGKQTRDKLQRLRDLYFDPEDEDGPNQKSSPHGSDHDDKAPSPKRRRTRRGGRSPGNKAPSPKRRSTRRGGRSRTSAKREGSGHGEQELGIADAPPGMTFCPVVKRFLPADWSLGPDLSANDAIRQWAPLMAQFPS
ncbi:hypothetical protein BJX63DRAFT_435733 [Aspergillus granulosus]|uniref:HNH nuclease domain-containing protein n=1 Tax=Aspergillus granulosus TaxID=176169 RepID=A0ABR4H0U9_9EURO